MAPEAGPMLPATDNVLPVLLGIHKTIRQRLLNLPEEATFSERINVHGHVQRQFDLAADSVILNELGRAFPDAVVLSEESGLRSRSDGQSALRFLVDPVDGSDNYRRGLPLSAVSIAVLEPGEFLTPGSVRWAMVGRLDQDLPLVAGLDVATRQGEEIICVSKVKTIADSFLSCELNHFDPTRQVRSILSRARAVRSYGCASLALALVARGALDAHVDARGRLTAESFLAAAFLVERAGGCVLDLDGNEFKHLTDLRATARIVAAASPELAHEIADEINES